MKAADGTEVVSQLTWGWGMLPASAGGPDGVTRGGAHNGSGRQKREAGRWQPERDPVGHCGFEEGGKGL